MVVFIVTCTNDEGESWQAECSAGFEGDELAEGDWVDAIYSRKNRSHVLLLPLIPGGPTLGEDGVFRPASSGTIVGFLLVGILCLGLWLAAVLV
jgi:hypothetical protein